MKGQEENEGSAVTSWKTRIKKRYKRWKRRQIKKKNDPEYQKKKRAAARFRKKLVRYLSHAWMFPSVFFILNYFFGFLDKQEYLKVSHICCYLPSEQDSFAQQSYHYFPKRLIGV